MEYYQTHGHHELTIIQELKKDHRLISVKNPLQNEFSENKGVLFNDCYHHTPFILVAKEKNSVTSLGTLVHEIGHIEDIDNLYGNKELNYYIKSIYQEVNAIYREKEFYEFLIKNNINKELAKTLLNDQLDQMIYESLAIVLLSNLPDGHLKRNKYKKMTDKKIRKLFPDLVIGDIEFDSKIFQEIDIYEDLQYSYGQVLSSYFLENPDQYQWFKERKNDMFNKRLLDELGITSSEVVKVLDKKYKNK